MKKKKKSGDSRPRGGRGFPYEFRLKMVRLHLDEGYSAAMLSEQFSVSTHSIKRWCLAYRRHGTDGLKPKIRTAPKPRVPQKVRDKAVEVRTRHPEYGPRRISDVLRRSFLLPASPSTVQRTLAEKGMTNRPRRKPVKNPSKPRFFERARPNQLWQSDIMTFRLAGRNAYLIGYIDDYSRYITGLGLYRSQTAAHVKKGYR